MGTEYNLIRDFEKEIHTLLNSERQVEKENRKKSWI